MRILGDGDRLREDLLLEAVLEEAGAARNRRAGNLKDIFARLRAADDLEFKAGADAPTLRVDDLTVAGA